ncbi:glutamate receptor ionotropic, kainate 1-like [Rhagoletis pomonella]|uniref:glutamate receptor ionotropic, kainate 1-like n=1 Tax=Rhagoletis pomonella TaxID=28610 RepID=UPI001783B69A|nr:glutamate receptor ionotropic, kainate 1-like [Rhagoletis pomonella]
MKVLLHVLLSCMLFQLTAQLTTAFEVVKIGVIFFNDEWELVSAFDTAIRDINELEMDVRLEPIKHFISYDDSLTLQELACDLIDNGAAAIFGPSSKTNSDIVEVICNTTGIPHLQFDWHANEAYGGHSRNHKLTVNVAPTEQMLSCAFLDIMRMKQLDWKSFTIVYENSRSLARMQRLFGWRQLHKAGIKLWHFNRGDDYRVIWKLISNSREKYVVLDCPSDIITEVLNASIYFNMTGQFNHWFLTSLDTHTSNIRSLYSRNFVANMIAVRVRPYMPPPVHDEADVFENEQEDQIITIRSKLLYDAIVLYFNALRRQIRNLHYQAPKVRCHRGYWRTGLELLDQMKLLTSRNVTPPYKTQKMQLNKYGEREEFNLEIYNPMVERITHIWNKNKNLVAFEDLVEAKEMKKQKYNEVEDFTPKRVKYTVATRIGEPYFMWRQEPEGVHYEGNERFEGYAVDLIYSLAQQCKFDFVFEPVPDNNYGSYDPITDEWNGIIRQLIDNNAQIGICDLTITQARRSVVDFTVPFMQLGVSILFYREPPPPKNLFGFLSPYSLDVWIYLLVAIMITALVLVVVGRVSQLDWISPIPHDPDPAEVENIWNLSNSLWLNIGSILNQGCDILPKGPAMRLFTAFWWIFSLLLSQTYIAKLAAFITASKMESSITNLHGLIDQNKIQFGMLKGGSTSFLFSESNESEYRLAWNKMVAMKPDAFTSNNREGVDRVKRSRGRYAYLLETTTLQYYLNLNCELKQIGEPFNEKHYGIAVPLNAPFRSNLSVGILKLSEKGELYKMKRKWFTTNETNCDVDLDEDADNGQYTMESVGGLFIVLIGGILVSILIGIFEFLWNVEQISVKEKLPTMVIFKAELKFFLRFWQTRKPLRTYAESRGSTSTGYSSFEQTASTSTAKKKRKKKSKKIHEQ